MKIKHLLKSPEKMFFYVHIFMAILLVLISSLAVVFNEENQLVIGIWCGVFLLTTLIRHITVTEKNKIRWVMPYIEILIIFYILTIDSSGIPLALTAIILMDIILDYQLLYGIIFGVIIYLNYMYFFVKEVPEMPLSNKVLIMAIAGLQFVLYNGFAYLAKKYSIQRAKLEETTAELHSQMIALEQMTVLKERNRIAGEIHNTVGHQLTTALIQIEAAQMLIDRDQEEAKKRLGIIKEQVRAGLGELRKSIQAINADEEYKDLEAAIKALLRQVQNHAGVDINLKINPVEDLRLSMKKIIYHIILESITNGIRHGQCEKLEISISRDDEGLTLHVFNDGLVPADLKYGYGLNQIKDKVKELEGAFMMKLNEVGWFGLMIKLPIHYREEDGHE